MLDTYICTNLIVYFVNKREDFLWKAPKWENEIYLKEMERPISLRLCKVYYSMAGRRNLYQLRHVGILICYVYGEICFQISLRLILPFHKYNSFLIFILYYTWIFTSKFKRSSWNELLSTSIGEKNWLLILLPYTAPRSYFFGSYLAAFCSGWSRQESQSCTGQDRPGYHSWKSAGTSG